MVRPKYSPEFEKFWEAYPRKVAKPYTFECWKRKVTKDMHDQIYAAVEAQKKESTKFAEGGQYVAHPSKWINQGYWTNETKAHRREMNKEKPQCRLFGCRREGTVKDDNYGWFCCVAHNHEHQRQLREFDQHKEPRRAGI